MIERLVLSKRSKLSDLLDFILSRNDSDLYYTIDNIRIYITDEPSLKRFLRLSVCTYIYKTKGDIKGVIAVWRVPGEPKRYEVKITAMNIQVATDLFTILTWNFNYALILKIRKDSMFVSPAKYKGWRFQGAQGTQLLLERPRNEYEYKPYTKEADLED